MELCYLTMDVTQTIFFSLIGTAFEHNQHISSLACDLLHFLVKNYTYSCIHYYNFQLLRKTHFQQLILCMFGSKYCQGSVKDKIKFFITQNMVYKVKIRQYTSWLLRKPCCLATVTTDIWLKILLKLCKGHIYFFITQNVVIKVWTRLYTSWLLRKPCCLATVTKHVWLEILLVLCN